MTKQKNAAPLRAKLKNIWLENESVLRERIAILQKAVPAAEAGALAAAECDAARNAAHKLAGSLGMFGLLEASALASELEQRLERLGAGERTELGELMKSLEESITRGMQ